MFLRMIRTNYMKERDSVLILTSLFVYLSLYMLKAEEICSPKQLCRNGSFFLNHCYSSHSDN